MKKPQAIQHSEKPETGENEIKKTSRIGNLLKTMKNILPIVYVKNTKQKLIIGKREPKE
jgi:hypothetical protein